MPVGGACGPNCELRYCEVTHSFDDAKADSVMQKYDAFAWELASGDSPTWFYGAASIASLMPLVKKAVTQADVEAMRQPDVRPVAVGEVTLRSILTSVTASVTPAMADVLAPQQVAVGVSGGISIMINGIRILLEQRGDDAFLVSLRPEKRRRTA